MRRSAVSPIMGEVSKNEGRARHPDMNEIRVGGCPSDASERGVENTVENQCRLTTVGGYCRRMLLGYARVSTADQNPAHQIDALRRAGGVTTENIHVDHVSGAKASRPQLDVVLALLDDGDILVITHLDRLSRSVLHLITLGADLRKRGVGLKVLEQGIDTATAEGRAMFEMLSVLAELQRELAVNNVREGVAAARTRGRKGGRPPKLTDDQVQLAQQLYDGGEHTVVQIADMLGVPRTTVYGHLNKAAAAKTTGTVSLATTPEPAAPESGSVSGTVPPAEPDTQDNPRLPHLQARTGHPSRGGASARRSRGELASSRQRPAWRAGSPTSLSPVRTRPAGLRRCLRPVRRWPPHPHRRARHRGKNSVTRTGATVARRRRLVHLANTSVPRPFSPKPIATRPV